MLSKIDTSRPVTFEVAAGYTVKASSASIAFLWSNWEVLYAFHSQKIRASRGIVDELPIKTPWELAGSGSWRARGFGGKGDWWLEKAHMGVQHGHFAYFTKARALACPLWARTVMEYDRIDEERISYRGTGVAALPQVFRPLHPLLRLLGSRTTLYINKIGGDVAEIITEHPESVCKVAGDKAWSIYRAFMKEEQAIRAGHKGRFQYFAVGEEQLRPAFDDLQVLKKKLQRVEELLHLSSADLFDYESSLSVFPQDPHLALVKNRMIIDKMVHLIYEREVGSLSPSLSPMQRVQDLRMKSLNVPRSILVSMATVIDLGDPSCQLTGRAGALDVSAYSISFQSTLRVTEWFFTEYLTPESRLSDGRPSI